MKYVLDASTAIRWVTTSPDSSKAVQLRDEYRLTIHELVVPSLFPAEVASALTKMERQKLIPVGRAGSLLADVMLTPPVLFSYGPMLNLATDISSQARSGLLDCLHVVLAEREKCDVITADDKLVRNLQAQYPFIKALSSL